MKLNVLYVAAVILSASAISHPAQAASVSPTDPRFLLVCEEVLRDGAVTPDYIQMIVDYALPRDPQRYHTQSVALGSDPAVSDRLSKWPGKIRVVVRTEAPLLQSQFTHLALPPLNRQGFAFEYVWDNDDSAELRDGDLVVYVGSRIEPKNGKIADERLRRTLIAFYGDSDGVDNWITRTTGGHTIDVIRNADNSIRRAMVVADFRDSNWLDALLTSALNPNPGNAAYRGLPGGTPEEKRIYDKIWVDNGSYGLMWGREFQAYLAVLADSSVKAGATRDDLVIAATRILNTPSVRKSLFTMHNCKTAT